MQNLQEIQTRIETAIKSAADLAALDAVRVAALGKKGEVSLLMRTLGSMTPEQRQEFGPKLNALKTGLNTVVSARRQDLEDQQLQARLASETIDVSLPAQAVGRGSIHPVSQVFAEANAIFADMGFVVATGPDIETDFYNFTALNFPPKHPARDMHDTFFFAPDADGERKVLRTHTSPVQIRTLQAAVAQANADGTELAPIRIIAPGRTYRCDSDQTHTPMFHQVEGLVIDKTTHMGHLKGCLQNFVSAFFEREVKVRFRPHHFPFTEPSAEMDIGYERVGNEIRIGQGDQWMEILGCGMVHPEVLRLSGVDPDIYQGFAFGMGVDRLAMLKYGIPDLRDFFACEQRWLEHYGFSPLHQPNLATGLSS
ncbi:Phenylalanyl-tRNA synthetase alpha chain [hydrothermal vent metagenome]|uniref:Phenylalanine--tRNA ligase alpha subunit n=1 Tax=hydrothermal vent metagenome TaxID=652676 RepID=A0A3B0RXG5_9ZZZZ